MGDSDSGPLTSVGVDFSNETQAVDFLGEILDDTIFQGTGNAYARYFWYGVVVVIAIATICNVTETATLRIRFVEVSIHTIQRLILPNRIRHAAVKRPGPARPTNIIMKAFATVTAICREVSYPQFSPPRTASWLKIPPLGTILLISIYLGFVLALEFIQNDISGAQRYTAIGVRASWLAVAQVPLLILLAGKNNLIGLVTGVSYERLNILHRWVSRVLLLLATIHFGSQSYGWNEYGLMQLEWSTDTCPPTGIAAYAILLWLNLSTLAPFRKFSYEFFVVQHLITFFGFIIAVMMHLPSTALYSRVYIYIPIALYLIDRLVRTSRFAYNNVRPGRATLEAMAGGVTKIRVRNQQVKKWSPGAFVLLSMPKSGFGQSHPATIASTPTSHNGDLIFILKGHKGFTRRLLASAASSTTSLLHDDKVVSADHTTHVALIDGPYGGSQADFAAFDTSVLICASTGVTFALSILQHIAHRSSSQKLPLCRLEFIWIVKNSSWTSWVSEELVSAFTVVRASGIEVAFKIFITCDETLADSTDSATKSGCKCAKSTGPCCCTRIVEPDQDVHTPPTVETQVGQEKEEATTTNVASTASSISSNGQKSRRNPPISLSSCATIESGRPSFQRLLSDYADQAEGEMGIAVCGPIGLSTTVRNIVARLSDERAVHKGTGAQGIYLHTECFGW